MDIKREVNPEDYDIGVIIARFQLHELHVAHKNLIDIVVNNHNKVIIFLGVSTIQNTKKNPLDFAMRKAMVQEHAPNAVILPLNDQKSNAEWSNTLDNQIKIPFGDISALIYGGRDSFIPYYEGRYQTTELTTDTFISGTEIRRKVSKELINSTDFRAGVIHANSANKPVVWSMVGVCPFDKDGRILLAQRPNNDKWEFIMDSVGLDDNSDERAAKRILSETTGSLETGDLTYIASQTMDDWRYYSSEDTIMVRFFICEYLWGRVVPSDDFSKLKWFDLVYFDSNYDKLSEITPEHLNFMISLLEKVRKSKVIKLTE